MYCCYTSLTACTFSLPPASTASLRWLAVSLSHIKPGIYGAPSPSPWSVAFNKAGPLNDSVADPSFLSTQLFPCQGCLPCCKTTCSPRQEPVDWIHPPPSKCLHALPCWLCVPEIRPRLDKNQPWLAFQDHWWVPTNHIRNLTNYLIRLFQPVPARGTWWWQWPATTTATMTMTKWYPWPVPGRYNNGNSSNSNNNDGGDSQWWQQWRR